MTFSELPAWLTAHGIRWVELSVPDMAGNSRGKLLPVAQFAAAEFKLPVAVFGQTVHGTYYLPQENLVDRDMVITPDLDTLRVAPWAAEPTATVLMDCRETDGHPVGVAPRAVLKQVMARYAARGWAPVVAPEMEFYLLSGNDRADALWKVTDPYGTDALHDHGGFFRSLGEHCRALGIEVGAVSQELGRGQFEVNFAHGDPLALADSVFRFKRTLKHLAREAGMRATFVAKLDAEMPGSSMHIHQSVYGQEGANLFSNADGTPSPHFHAYLGGLQKYIPSLILLFAPYPNSYRRLRSHWSSPVNLEWGTENRTVGLRVPLSVPLHRRIENRLPGSDVNPYLAIAGSLACGLLGLEGQAECTAPASGSVYDSPNTLHRHAYEAIDAFRESREVRDVLGDEFVTLYSALKDLECREFEERIPPWERDELARIV